MAGSATSHRWLTYGWALAIVAVLYVAWIGVSRHMANRAIERAAEAKRASAYKPLPEAGPGVKILHFYAGTGEVVRGEHAVVCYGVQNAKAVRLEPPVEAIKPSLNRCIAVEPSRDTTYELRVTGEDGAEVSASFTIRVVPPPPRILFVVINKLELRRGEPLAICYGVKNATEVRLDPIGMRLQPSEKRCFQTLAGASLTYTLTATSAEGKTDSEKFRVTVK